MTSRTSTQPGCDTSDLLIIHQVFRNVFAAAPPLTRGVADGDRARTHLVADHLADAAAGLHIHHEGEDLILWDRLETRAPACALHVGAMRQQHAAIATLLEELDGAVARWRGLASGTDRDLVVAILEEIDQELRAHLRQEEDDIRPVAGEVLTQAEWHQLAEHGLAATPKKNLLAQLAAIVDVIPPADRAAWLRENVPPLPRLLFTLLGRRQYAAQLHRLYGADV